MRLWTTHQASVANYVHALVRDRPAAEDVLQETALLAFRKFPEYDAQRPFVAWVLGIARFKVMGLRRDAIRNRLVLDNEAMETFTEEWAQQSEGRAERVEALNDCIGQLANHARDVVRLRYFDNRTAEEIAGKLGANSGTIRVTLQRIRAQLRECIERKMRAEGGMA